MAKFKNIQFQVFHDMCMALGPVGKNKRGQIEWLFECFEDGPGCEGEFIAIPGRVKRGDKISCGCHMRDNIAGKIFYDSDGTPTCQALWYLESINGQAKWLFICLVNGPGCKETFPAYAFSVKSGKQRSCGCYKRLKVKEANTTHGMTNTPEYQSWVNMHQRCYNPNHPHYHYYGGKGIKVCWRWHKDNPEGFVNFLTYMGRTTDPNKNTIERFDNNGDYDDDGNVHKGWVDRKTQARNTSQNAIKDIEEAEFIRDLHNIGHSIASIARAVAATKGRSCSSVTISDIINNKKWIK